MSEFSFTIGSKGQTIAINPTELYSSFDGLNSLLHIPVTFTFRQITTERCFDVNAISAQLKFATPGILLSEVIVPIGHTVQYDESKYGHTFSFLLNERVINHIEKLRNGDVYFAIHFTVLISVTNRETLHTSQKIRVPNHMEKVTSNVSFEIPRSIWVEKILPNIGFQSFKLIEIPLSHKNLREAYSDIIFEFNKAEEYFNSQDYNQSVAYCRSALDALTRNLRKIKEGIKSETTFEWLQRINTDTFNWIDGLNKASSRIASKPHHAGHKKDFSRYEAESIYLVVLGLLNFIGHLKNE